MLPARENDNKSPSGRQVVQERSAGAIAYRKRGRTVLIFLLLDPFHKWAAPKGHVDPGETDEQAAIRELGEEAGLSGSAEADLGSIDLKFRRHGARIEKQVRYFLVRVPWNSHVRLGKKESGRGEPFYGFRWVPARRALDASDYENMRPIMAHALGILDKNRHIKHPLGTKSAHPKN